MDIVPCISRGEYFTEFLKIAFWKSFLTFVEMGRVSPFCRPHVMFQIWETLPKWEALPKQETFPNLESRHCGKLLLKWETFPVWKTLPIWEIFPNFETIPTWESFPPGKASQLGKRFPTGKTLPTWENAFQLGNASQLGKMIFFLRMISWSKNFINECLWKENCFHGLYML